MNTGINGHYIRLKNIIQVNNGINWPLLLKNTSSTRMRRGGSCLKILKDILYIRPFTCVELAYAVHQPGPCVRSVCEWVALLPSRNMTCVRPHCHGMERQAKTFSSFFTLHSAVFTSCTSQATLHLSSIHTSATSFTQQIFTHRSFYTQKLLQDNYNRIQTPFSQRLLYPRIHAPQYSHPKKIEQHVIIYFRLF